MAQPVLIYRGDTIEGVINLRQQDSCSGASSPFVIEAGSTIEVRFPGESSTVVLSTANPGEITIVDANVSILSLDGPAAKSLLMNVGEKQSINTVVTQGISGNIVTFQEDKILNVRDRANP